MSLQWFSEVLKDRRNRWLDMFLVFYMAMELLLLCIVLELLM